LKNDFQKTAVHPHAFTRKWQCTNTSEVFREMDDIAQMMKGRIFTPFSKPESYNHKIMCSSDPNLRLLCHKCCAHTHTHTHTHSPLPQALSLLKWS